MNDRFQPPDVVQREQDYVLRQGNEDLCSPLGYAFSSSDSSLLTFLSIRFTLQGKNFRTGPLFRLVSEQMRIERQPEAALLPEDFTGCDPLLSSMMNPGGVSHPLLMNLMDDPENNAGLLHVLFAGGTLVSRKVTVFLSRSGWDGNPLSLPKIVRNIAGKTQSAVRAAAGVIADETRCGVLLSLMFAERQLGISEFSVTAAGYASETPEEFHSLVSNWQILLCQVDEYLKFYCNTGGAAGEVQSIIQQGESLNVEFKSSLRWHIYEKRADAAIEHSTMKTVAAFLNSEGGRLVIGVSDDRNICGLEQDQFKNDDKFLLHLWNLIKTSIGESYSPYIQTSLELIGNKTVCLIRCLPSPEPVFLKGKSSEEEFFIRTGPSSTRLGVRETYEYIRKHF